MAKHIVKKVLPIFADYIFDWDYETYLLLGGYGSGKSHATVDKIIIRCLSEKHKILVVREVYNTLEDSCVALIKEVLEDMDLLAEDETKNIKKHKVIYKKSPHKFLFPNGSQIIFRGMDKPERLKSIHGVDIVWLEECSEIKYDGYKELLGRIRTPNKSLHFILTTNPIGKENWVYKHFFRRTNDDGEELIIMDDEELYNKKEVVKNKVYYHHSVPDDNQFLPKQYLQRLDDIKNYDKLLWRVARWGRFGPSGLRVLPQFKVAKNPEEFVNKVKAIPRRWHRFGMDFGFETSYNAVISCAVDLENNILYIYDEIYVNHITDDKMAELPEMEKHRIKENLISADCEDPKAISYYRSKGYKMRKCKKFAGSRLSYTRKVKRFREIICSPKCRNTIAELKDLTYKKLPNGDTVYDEFNIDPHTFSAIWYALDDINVADLKTSGKNTRTGY